MTIAKYALYYVAAAATAIAGILHLMLGPNNLGFNVNQGILFIAGGAAQVFWIIPIIRRWGKGWYAVGIAGTIILMALFFITRVPGNPITGRGGPTNNPIAITIEVAQGIFIGLAAAILVYESRKVQQVENAAGGSARSRNKHLATLAGITIVLVLAGLFVLPMTMPRPLGGPPGASSSQPQ